MKKHQTTLAAALFQPGVKSISNRRQRLIPAFITAGFIALAGCVSADIIYWNGTDTNWNNTASWSTSPSATTPNPAAVPGAADIATFSISSVTTVQTNVDLLGNQSVLGLHFLGYNTNTTTLQAGGGTANPANTNIYLGADGIVVDAGSGDVKIGKNNTGQKIIVNLGASQTWVNNSTNGSLTSAGISGANLVNGGYQLTIDGGGKVVIDNIITGTGGVTMINSNQLNLTAANTFSGPLMIDKGIVLISTLSNINQACSIGKSVSAAHITNLVFGGGTLKYAGTNPVSTDRGFTIGDDNGLTATISSYATDPTNTLVFTRPFALNLGGSGGKTLILAGINTGSNIFGCKLTDDTNGPSASALTKNGSGTWLIAGTNTYSGPTKINGGKLQLFNGGRLGSATALTIADLAAAEFDLNGNDQTIGSLAGTGPSGSVNLSANTLTINGSNTTSFGGVISDTSGGGFVMNGTGTQTLTGLNTFSGQVQVFQGTLGVNSLANAGVASPLGAATTLGNRNIKLGYKDTTGTLSYTGTGDSTDREIQIGGNSSTPTNTDVGSAIILNSGSGAISFTAAAFNNLNTAAVAARTLTLGGTNTATNTISGVIADNNTANGATIGVTKADTGTWVLAGVNTYSDVTTVSAGKLLVDGSLAAASAVSVATNATLGGTGSIGGATIVAAGGTLSPGASIGTLTFGGNLTLNAGAKALFELNTTNSPATNDYVVVSGTLSITGSILTVTNTGPALVAGDTFKLFSQPTGGFTSTNLPPLGPGLVWVTNNLAVDGSIRVSATATLTYSGNGNTGGFAPADGLSPYVSGATVAVLGNTGGLARTGYNFAGWTNSAGTFYNAGNTFTITGDTTLYAMWNPAVVTSPKLTNSVSGNVMTLTWGDPTFHLFAQTNALNIGLKTNSSSWGLYWISNSPAAVTNNKTDPAVFFRLSNQP